MIKIIEKRCPKNHLCPIVKMCPKDAIRQEGYEAPTIDQSKCIKCNICIKNCPHNVFEKED